MTAPKLTRPYRSNVRWAFLSRREEIPDSDDPTVVYLRRWRMFQTPLFAFYFHQIFLPDRGRDLHDHPALFVSLILKGGYHEEVVRYSERKRNRGRRGYTSLRGQALPASMRIKRTHKAGRINVIRRKSAHRIVSFTGEAPVWTLVFVGRRDPNGWGFWTREGYVPSKEYHERHA